MAEDVVRVRHMAIRQEDRKVVKQYDKDVFEIFAFMPSDRREIALNLAVNYYGGVPVSSFDNQARREFTRAATIDRALQGVKPDWWTGADNCMDQDFLDQLYNDILKFNDEFQEKLKKNQFAVGGPKA